MKPYLVFAGSMYYPLGGWEDFRDSFDTYKEAEAVAKALGGTREDSEWAHVVKDGKIIVEYTRGERIP